MSRVLSRHHSAHGRRDRARDKDGDGLRGRDRRTNGSSGGRRAPSGSPLLRDSASRDSQRPWTARSAQPKSSSNPAYRAAPVRLPNALLPLRPRRSPRPRQACRASDAPGRLQACRAVARTMAHTAERFPSRSVEGAAEVACLLEKAPDRAETARSAPAVRAVAIGLAKLASFLRRGAGCAST